MEAPHFDCPSSIGAAGRGHDLPAGLVVIKVKHQHWYQSGCCRRAVRGGGEAPGANPPGVSSFALSHASGVERDRYHIPLKRHPLQAWTSRSIQRGQCSAAIAGRLNTRSWKWELLGLVKVTSTVHHDLQRRIRKKLSTARPTMCFDITTSNAKSLLLTNSRLAFRSRPGFVSNIGLP